MSFFDANHKAVDWTPYAGAVEAPQASITALKRYRDSRENGADQDNPKHAFPSAGLEALRIKNSRSFISNGVLSKRRYPWILPLSDGGSNRDFSLEYDEDRGDTWFIIHGPNGVKMEGFSWQANKENGCPDRYGTYYYHVQYTECGSIKKWMQEKDLRYLARTGDVKTKFELARRYHRGDKETDSEKNIIQKDSAEAIVWYERAAGLKSVEAYLGLGEIYANGDEQVPKDVIKAIGWYKKAAELKSIESYLALGEIYVNGDRRFIRDEKKAIDYFRKAAELGNTEALNQLQIFANTRNSDSLCALECIAAISGPNKDKAQQYLDSSAGRDFFDIQRCTPRADDACVSSSSPSLAIILGTTLGVIGLIALIWWWYITPQPPGPNTSEMSEEDIQKAIEKEDFVILNALLTDKDVKRDMKAWSFIGLDRGKLYLDDEKLLKRGIIFSKKKLLQVARDYLDDYQHNPNVNPLYLRRLAWGINRLLKRQRLSPREISTCQDILSLLGSSSKAESSKEQQNSASFLTRDISFASPSSNSSGGFSFSRPLKLNTTNKAPIEPGLINNSFLCPITHQIMLDPVLTMDGHTYEREAILQALDKSMLSPMTGQAIESKSVIPSHNTRSMIRDFLTQHPECWQEVYVSAVAVNDLLALSAGTASLDLQKWEAILRADPRLLTLPLQGVTLLEVLCNQTESIVKTYLPALLNLLTSKNWQDLIRIHSAQDWLKLVAHSCERCSAPGLAVEFLNKLQAGLEVKINPLEMAVYALEEKNFDLFKLALSQLKDVNEAVDGEKNTLLHLAAKQGQTEMIHCLGRHGAHFKQRNAAGLKAEDLARIAGFEATADQIAVLKLAPVLERMGLFTGLRRVEALEKEMQQMKASASNPR
ncbi:MAG: hypothetical protein K0R24_18 [Gammaproteobacteria bacterium]|nr:hypothetical protein [Gammaproteobacteria bacterium]